MVEENTIGEIENKCYAWMGAKLVVVKHEVPCVSLQDHSLWSSSFAHSHQALFVIELFLHASS